MNLIAPPQLTRTLEIVRGDDWAFEFQMHPKDAFVGFSAKLELYGKPAIAGRPPPLLETIPCTLSATALIRATKGRSSTAAITWPKASGAWVLIAPNSEQYTILRCEFISRARSGT